jgi:molybdopterin synthase catalytic subunit
MFHCDVVDVAKNKITLEKAQQFIESHKCGASLFFVGTVRDNNNDKMVTGITYDSHDGMVRKSFEEIFTQAIKVLKLEHPVAFVEHAKGYVPLGGISVVIAVACKHRNQVYEFSRYIIEQIKKQTPIWKKEHYLNEDAQWLDGQKVEVKK